MNQCYLLGLSNFQSCPYRLYGGEREDIMFKYRVKFTDDNTAEVTASRDTIILLETLIRYGIVKKITVKS